MRIVIVTIWLFCIWMSLQLAGCAAIPTMVVPSTEYWGLHALSEAVDYFKYTQVKSK